MQKQKRELVSKSYSAKEDNGITLVALTITIIVMLILVSVTVAVAINSGLFESANEAAIREERLDILKQIIGMTEYTYDEKIDIPSTVENINKSSLKVVEITRTEWTKLHSKN